MNLAHTYAQTLESLGTKDAAEKVIERMRAKGHLSLLPQVVRILERSDSVEHTVLTVAKKEDAQKHAGAITTLGGDPKNAKVVVDPRIVGNYMARHGQKFIDASYRRQLVSLYQKTIRS